MSYTRLRAFHAVATEGSFTVAAQSLGVTQPTLSAQVKALEESYGVALSTRGARGTAATTLGEQLLEITRRLFLLEEEANELLARARTLTTGHLRVVAGGPYHVVPFLAEFAERYPAVHISLAIGNSEAVLDSLLHYRADVAVITDIAENPRPESILRAQPLLALFIPEPHPWGQPLPTRLG